MDHLLLLETPTLIAERIEVDALLDRATRALAHAGAEVIEARVTADHKRLFVIVATDDATESAVAHVRATLAENSIEVDDLAPVRLVGADLDDVRAVGTDVPRYLVEWDLPDDLTMDAYLARKKEKAPLYAEVPEVAFRRTYVREDLDKCLCFYDAPCVEDVARARDAVSAPIDRLHELA